MLSVLIRLVRRRWPLAVLYLSRLWGHLLHLISVTAIKTWNAGVDENKASGVSEPAAGTLEPNPQEFPSATEDQRKQARKAFIESIDSDAVCTLASKFHNGRSCRVVGRESGSFNVCFFVAFGQDEPEWVVRIPIEPALDDPWNKLLSEVSTLR